MKNLFAASALAAMQSPSTNAIKIETPNRQIDLVQLINSTNSEKENLSEGSLETEDELPLTAATVSER